MNISNIYDAKGVLKDAISRTLLIYADKLHRNLRIRVENLQGTGAFKLRGAYHKLHSLTQKEREKGMITVGAGNRAQRVVYFCMKMGIKRTIVMPKIVPLSKTGTTRSYGATAELQGGTFNDAYEYAKNLQEITGTIFVEPFDDEYVTAGRGTINPEILDKFSNVDTVIAPIGGGGLTSGITVTIEAMCLSCRITGVQSKHASSMKQPLGKKEIIELQDVSTIVDGIAVRAPGKLTYKLCSKYVDEVVTANEEEVVAAILILLEKVKVVTEGAGATGIAATMFGKVGLRHHKCVTVLSGGNIDISPLPKVIGLSSMKTRRKAVINMNIMDKPGNLSCTIELISRTGVNIISANHSRIQNAMLSNQYRIGVIIETNDNKHIEDMFVIPKNNGYGPYLAEHI